MAGLVTWTIHVAMQQGEWVGYIKHREGCLQSGGKKASMSSGRKSKHVAGPRIGGDFRAIISTSTTPNLVGHHQHTLQRKPTLSATLNGYGHIPEHVALVAVVLSQNDWVRV